VSIVFDRLLGPAGKQRMRVSQSLLALVVYSTFAVLQHGEVLLGLIDERESWILTGIYLSGSILFFLVVRFGWNERLGSDPSLTLPQTAFALTISAGSYAITGPARGAVMTLLVLVLAFASFSLRPAQSRALAWYAFGLFAVVMLWKSRTEPSRYPPAVEFVHFGFAAIVAAGVSVLAGRLGVMRMHLKSQKLDLERALERIGQLATQDELTGLANRRHMLDLMGAEQVRRARQPAPMMVALIDIDRFKSINDAHGHQAGDAVLKAFADLGREQLRATDVLSRWGGEEFLLMLPNTSAEQALDVVERLRASLAATSFENIAPGLKVSFSAGLSLCATDESLGSCIERADQGMYRGKTLGRNQSVLL
jgi:diguanylate cyclase (GGDEF)-like protein